MILSVLERIAKRIKLLEQTLAADLLGGSHNVVGCAIAASLLTGKIRRVGMQRTCNFLQGSDWLWAAAISRKLRKPFCGSAEAEIAVTAGDRFQRLVELRVAARVELPRPASSAVPGTRKVPQPHGLRCCPINGDALLSY